MRRTILLGLLGASTLTCGRDLALPEQPASSSLPPVVGQMEPTIAIASFGSRVQLSGAHLAGAEEVRVGPFSLKEGAFNKEGSAGEMISFNVAAEKGFDPAQLDAVDGQSLPVRIVRGGIEYAVSQPLRVFSGRSTVEEIAPRNLAPGQLVYLRGRGFDAQELLNNQIGLTLHGAPCDDPALGVGGGSAPDGGGATGGGGASGGDRGGGGAGGVQGPDGGGGPSGPGGGGPGGSGGAPVPGSGGEPGIPPPPSSGPMCVMATVFWATDNLVLAVVPDGVPGGVVEVSYENLAFRELDAFVDNYMADASHEAGDMFSEPAAFGGADPSQAGAGGDPPPVERAAAADFADSLSDVVYVWRDPGLITLETPAWKLAPGRPAVISAADRLFYPDVDNGGLLPQLMVLVDGAPLAELGEALDPSTGQPRIEALTVRLPNDLVPGLHSLQVVNPFFESPLAWLRVSP